MTQDLAYVTFPSTYWALRAERLLKEYGIPVTLRPVPRTMSSSCGICLEVEASSVQDVVAASTRLGLELEGICTKNGHSLLEQEEPH
ncbi:MAG: DUF3343 domain-containing protein [Bacillota bacterium]|jgi:hypothetical protein